MKITKQTKANKRQEAKNKEYSNYLKQRPVSRSLIKNKATQEDIEEFQIHLREREQKIRGFQYKNKFI